MTLSEGGGKLLLGLSHLLPFWLLLNFSGLITSELKIGDLGVVLIAHLSVVERWHSRTQSINLKVPVRHLPVSLRDVHCMES